MSYPDDCDGNECWLCTSAISCRAMKLALGERSVERAEMERAERAREREAGGPTAPYFAPTGDDRDGQR